MSKFSEVIKRERYNRHMSQDEFARLLGTSKQNISRYEKGLVSPMVRTAAKYANILGMTLNELNGGDSSGEPATHSDRITLAEELLRSLDDDKFDQAMMYLKFLSNQ